jgi:diaminohydroxyphosphoribosylaminopyrimidine deaminase/5-amino-6-(5-phosphoribosylamino)uracil reductase
MSVSDLEQMSASDHEYMSAIDDQHMAQALVLARRGLGLTWPNPSVGAIVVMPLGEIVGRGWTAPGGRPHAEANALEQAGAKAKGSSIYVTLEPCAHKGRGPACADIIVAAKPKRVVIGLRDPDPRTAGQGIARLQDAGINVEEGVLAEDAAAVTLGHVMRVTKDRPAVTLKIAVGSDGLVPRGHGRPVWVTGPDARAYGHLLRARNDAILIGRGTVAADDPTLTCRLPGMSSHSPVRVVLDRRLRTPPEAKLFAGDAMVPVWLICADGENQPNAEGLLERGGDIVPVPVDAEGLISLKDALATLAGRGITSVLVEGGPTVARAFLEADLVDEAVIYQGPNPAGDDGLTPFAGDGLDRLTESGHFTVIASRFFGPDRMTCWRRIRTCSLESSAA